jgi:cobalt-zinc-cadmium efflux system outer membrane protein
MRHLGLLVLLLFAKEAASSSEPVTPPMKTPASATLTLEQVLGSVDIHYPLVIASIQDRDRAQGDLLAAQGGFDPVLKSALKTTPSGKYSNQYAETTLEQATPLWGARLFAGYAQGQGQFKPYQEGAALSFDRQLNAGVEIPLLRGGLIDDRRARIRSNENALEGAAQSLTLQRIDSRRLATHRYYDWVAAAEKLKIAKSLLQLAIDRDDAMAHRVSKGDAAKIERVDNQRSITQREAILVSSTRSFEKSSLELSLFFRDSAGQPILPTLEQVPSTGLPSPQGLVLRTPQPKNAKPDPQLTTEVLRQHPEIRRLQAQIAQNTVEQKLASNSILPKLDAALSVAQGVGQGLNSSANTEYQAAVKLEFPLLFRTGRGRSDSVLAQGIKLDTQLEFARDRIRVAITDQSQALDAAKDRIVLSQQEVGLSLQVEEAERVKLRHGDSNVLTVNLREQATADARSRAVDALADYYRAQADLIAAMARPQL